MARAYAADLSGGGIADLEERVAELEAHTSRKGNRKQSLEISGHIASEVFFLDERDSTTSIEDDGASPTRFRLKGSAKIDQSWSAGFLLEIQPQFAEGDTFARLSYLWINDKTLGTVQLGLQSLPTDGAGQTDLGKTGVASRMLSTNFFSRALFKADDLFGFDGDRAPAVAWWSPEIYGLTVGVALVDDDEYEGAIRYAKARHGIQFAISAGYRRDRGAWNLSDTDTYVGSASLKHVETGLFISAGGGIRDADGFARQEIYEVRGGKVAKLLTMGTTTFFGRFERGEVEFSKRFGGDAEIYGAGIIQNVDPAAMELYFTWDHIDAPGLGLSEDDVFRIGSRVKF